MSHLKERKEKICLNCNAATYGRFCHICGQENIETKESFWHLVFHFIADIFHYDGKFFRTIRYLIFRPGFLTAEYIAGRRTSYLHPIRLYVFTSAVFFLIFFSFIYKQEDLIKISSGNDKKQNSLYVQKSYEELREIKESLSAKLKIKTNKYVTHDLKALMQEAEQDSILIAKDSGYIKKLDYTKYGMFSNEFINLSDTVYGNTKQYDSIQASLKSKDKDNFIQKYFQHKNLSAREVTRGLSQEEATIKILDSFFHKFPQMLFVYLPFFSLSLMLLHIRNKQYFYVNHVVFSIHLFCGIFLLMLLSLLVSPVIKAIGLNSLKVFLVGIQLLLFYKSFRNFYKQSRFKTFIKLFFLAFINVFIISILLVIFSIIATLNIK
jgi:hypothetical protein